MRCVEKSRCEIIRTGGRKGTRRFVALSGATDEACSQRT